MDKGKKILVSGVKPTARQHIGNYFGALRQFMELSEQYESYIFIADYHALNFVQNAKELEQNVVDIALDYLAVGLDPKKVTLFKQSDVPEVTELCWIFFTITTMPYLARAHAYKDASTKGKEASVGTFNYPMLMAADILIQDADVVPVGQDQKQHVEYARDTAEKFNRIFSAKGGSAFSGGEIFKLPEPMILTEVAVVPGIDGRKMSKSYGNTIELFASDEEIKNKVMSIVTDSGEGIPKNVYALHKLVRSESELKSLYENKKGKYQELKEALADDLMNFIRPLREKREKLAQNKEAVLEILKSGGARARSRAASKMSAVRHAVGVELY